MSFTFVLTPFDIANTTAPVEIAPGHTLRRATDTEVLEIKDVVLRSGFLNSFRLQIYEHAWTALPDQGSSRRRRNMKPLPSSQWRYWIVSFDGSNRDIDELAKTGCLLDEELELGFTVVDSPAGRGHMVDSRAISGFLDWCDHRLDLASRIPVFDVGEFKRLHAQLLSAKDHEPGLFQAVGTFQSLSKLPLNESFLVLGYIALIESLITRQPQQTDPYSSLNHQMRTKMPLLAKRFAPPLVASGSFQGLTEEKVWSELYAYRSAIAHGTLAKNRKQVLKHLGDYLDVPPFLRAAAKRLLRFTLNDPEFVADLKKC